MAWTQSDLDKLGTAIADGVLEVQFADGRRIRRQSLADMRALRTDMKNEIAAAAAMASPPLRSTRGRIVR